MKKETNKIAFFDARYEDYSGKKRFGVTHPSHKRRLIVAVYGDGPGLVCSGGEASAPQAKKPKQNLH